MLAENIKRIKEQLGIAQLVVVSKFRTIAEIQAAYNAGQRVFAENRVQALLERRDQLPADIEWHLIGHLQSNKVRQIAAFIQMIQSVDSLKLLQIIDQEAKKNDRIIDCLLQIHVAKEETKFGFAPDEFRSFIEGNEWRSCQNIRLRGIMGMATNTDDESLIRSEFTELKHLFEQSTTILKQDDFDTLSMGMSSDYKIAIACGSNMARIGSIVFGG